MVDDSALARAKEFQTKAAECHAWAVKDMARGKFRSAISSQNLGAILSWRARELLFFALGAAPEDEFDLVPLDLHGLKSKASAP